MDKKLRFSLVLPLVGVTVAWLALIGATFWDLNWTGAPMDTTVRGSTYLVLAGLSVAAVLSLLAFRMADERHAVDGKTSLVAAVYRFAGLAVVLSLAFLVVFAFGSFLSSFNSGFGDQAPTLMERILGTYLPIILAAGVVVFVLLQATLYRKTLPVEGAADKGMSATQKALAYGYALPVIGTAFAIIIGLIVYDAQGQKLEVWSWVVIQLLVGLSILFGTRFAAAAKAAKPVIRVPKVGGAVGAVRLNYVLSVVFAGVVSVMSFTFGSEAVISLGYSGPKVNSVTFDWFFSKLLPAFLLLVLVQVAIYLSITLRNKEVTKSQTA